MAVKAWQGQQKSVDEVFFQNDAVSLCLLVNRRARTLRVVDFRAGPSPAKRLIVLALARREGARKVFTLVERDEVSTWVKLGFAREATIPGFYKRSDAFLLGATVPPPGRAKALAGPRGAAGSDALELEPGDDPTQSETRLAVAAGASAPPAVTAAQALMERTLVAAKKVVKEEHGRPLPAAKLAPVGEGEARKAVAAALKTGRALTAFEPFGRDAERAYFMATVRGGFQLCASTESQACFGNALIELLQAPRSEAERLATAAALAALCDRLTAEGVVSSFALSPSDDVTLATVMVQGGFRRTGLLADHLACGEGRKDAIVWSRKLANPADD